MSILGSVPFHQIHLEPLILNNTTRSLSTITKSTARRNLTRQDESVIIPWLFNAAVSSKKPLSKEQLSRNDWFEALHNEIFEGLEEETQYKATSHIQQMLNHIVRLYLSADIIERRGVSVAELRQFDMVIYDKIACCLRADINPDDDPISGQNSPMKPILVWWSEMREEQDEMPMFQQRQRQPSSRIDDDDDGVVDFKQQAELQDSDDDDNNKSQ
jgi:hypothetical protein